MDTNEVMPTSGKKRALVVGGGFTGVEAAADLSKDDEIEVTLVSDRDFLGLYPTSIGIPTHEIEFDEAKVSLK